MNDRDGDKAWKNIQRALAECQAHWNEVIEIRIEGKYVVVEFAKKNE